MYVDQMLNRRIAAVKAADAINAIEGVPVSDYAKTLSACWARGEITDQQMKAALLASHRKLAAMVNGRANMTNHISTNVKCNVPDDSLE